MKNITLKSAKEILKKNGYLGIFWHKEDIKGKTTSLGFNLTDKELSDFIEVLESRQDAEIGFNWDFISDIFDIWIESKSYNLLLKDNESSKEQEVLVCEIETNESIENWWKDDQYFYYGLKKQDVKHMLRTGKQGQIMDFTILKVY